MYLNDLNQNNTETIKRVNQNLKEQYGIHINTAYPTRKKLERILESAKQNLIQLKSSSKKFHLDPEYAKFLGIRDVAEAMVSEGMYVNSPRYNEMKEMVTASVQELMDSGYTVDEAAKECMNRFRRDDRFAHDDEHVLPIVLTAANEYYETCNAVESVGEEITGESEVNFSESVLKKVAKETGINIRAKGGRAMVENRIATMAKVSNKTPENIIKFLGSLNEADFSNGVKMFGRKISEANAFNRAKTKAVENKLTKFKFNGKLYETGLAKSDLHLDLSALNEEVDMNQAEVVMAVRAISDDLQSQLEKIGRTINEDMPAIVKQMQAEMGTDTATNFQSQMDGVLNTLMDSTRDAKSGIDTAVATLTGDEIVGGDPMGGMGDELGPDMGGMDGEMGAGGDPNAMDMNEPALQGGDEPLGRAAVEV
jgi:hypothetical protein